MLVAWTTLDRLETAEEMAGKVVAEGLAVCAQVDSAPVISVYRWDGKLEKTREYRITFKLRPEQLPLLEAWVHQRHPYAVPEWIVVRAEHVGEKYLSWAKANSTLPPL